MRPSEDNDAVDAIKTIVQKFGDNALTTQLVANALIRIERSYDKVVWQTLLALAAKENALAKFVDQLQNPEFADLNTAKLVNKVGSDFGFDNTLLDAWAKLADS